VTVYVEPGFRAALELKQFLRRERVGALGPSHPMASGYRLIDRHLRGKGLTLDEIAVVSALEFFATAVVEHLIGRDVDYRLRRDLANTRACRALWFEALVLRLVIQPEVGAAYWRRYEEAGSDIVADDPMVQVECKLVSAPNLDRMLIRAFDGAGQRRDGEGAFVIVAGSEHPFTDEAIAAASDAINKTRAGWFARHPEVAGVLLLMPRQVESRIRDTRLNIPGIEFNQMSALWLRNNAAIEALPKHFDLRPRS
jgi:hypothetical protein